MEKFDVFSQGRIPYSMEAEQSVLGSVIVDPTCLPTVVEAVKPDYFYNKINRDIFLSIAQLFNAGAQIDVLTILDAVIKDGVFDNEQDAKQYLQSIAQIVPTASHINSYINIISQKYHTRSLALIAGEILEKVNSGEGEASELLDIAEQKIYEIRQGRNTSGLRHIKEIIVETYDHLQKLSSSDKGEYLGTPSGFSYLDKVTVGLNKSDLIIVAARPGMGKTSFALNIAQHVAKNSKKMVAVFSLEMTREQIVLRMLSSEALVPSQALRSGEISGDEWIRLAEGAEVLSKIQLYLDDTSSITVPEMKAKLRKEKNVGLVVIDYLQLMNSHKNISNRVQEISEITRNLKIMAKELNVPVILLSQLSRSSEQRADHRPGLSDLRDSGSIEQDADIVMFLYRDEYYQNATEDKNLAECIISKNRHGETKTVKLGWNGEFTKFSTVELYKDEP